MKHLKSKISRVLVLYIVLFSSVITLILTAVQLRLDYNTGINVIQQRIKQIEFTNIDSITQSLWTLDHSSIQIQLDGLSRINDIIFVKITDADNKLIASSGITHNKNTIVDSIDLYQKYRGKDTPLGTLTITATKENLYRQLIDTVIVILISQAIKTFLVSLFVLVIFYYLVTRHLHKISENSAMISLNKKPAHITLDRKKSGMFNNDELDQLVNSINTMSNDIYDAYIDQYNNQHKLANREAKFSAMFDAISDAIVFADSERKFIQTNPAFHKQFGYNTEELQNCTTLMLYANPEEYIQQGNKRYNPETKSSPSVYEIEYKRKDGTTFPSETMGGAVILPDGTQIGYIGIIRDISARKQAEEEKEQLQKQLQQSQKIEAIGQLTGGIAHDFNNILSSILGYSELATDMIQHSGEPKLIQYIERINVAGERARKLVAQLLAFSRSTSGDPQPIKLPDLIKDVTSLIQSTIPSSIELMTKIDDSVPSVFMDQTQMHQILMNLCINARDAMQGSGTLTIKLSYSNNINEVCSSCKDHIQGDYVRLTVEDTGTGIQAELLEKIFDPFLTTKDVGKGTGMGLSVVHGILHKHDSHIIVNTELMHGSSFQLLIPPISEHSLIPDTEKAPDRPLKDIGNGKHILIVDDEESVAMFLQDFLESYGYRVTSTTSSQQAIDFVEQATHNFNLIITDQTMPDITGTEMIKQIFQINPEIPVILCSGYNEQVSEKEALDLGCSSYLGKPVNNQLLIQTIQEILESHQDR